ncbi:MAG: segregation/condensation protein A [Selenomonadales bacterium]|jgi:segregation and condensation protein A|nr:segregation/condensation protein A [Selenomonadales bacterium]MBQ2246964.1 segregation/condensation protein A [Selenomonadales bacterium]MBQ5637173.1 segregation/condensation protein A [Selenomonadales bacterium]MBQ5859510.1 segregation/condensation protein A [Selenomonadales bacterium]
MSYQLKLEVFEGPLALLMHLIEKSQIDIYDIPIAEITEQYLAYLKQMEEVDLEIASEFLVMAATLLQIKSRMLLPKKKAEDDTVEEDPRDELVARLLEYKRYQEVSRALSDMAEARRLFFGRSPLELPRRQEPYPQGMTTDKLVMAFMAVWESKQAEEDFVVVRGETVTVQDKMGDILYLLRKCGKTMEFRETLIRARNRDEMIASFLAILELLKLNKIRAEQEQGSETIMISLVEGDSEPCFTNISKEI